MNQIIKKRIEMIRRGEMPVGYKKDKEGLHPSDWPAKKMSKWLALCERPVTLSDNESYELVTVRRAFGGVDSRGIYQGKDILVKNYFKVHSGDFLISKRQIAHGACGLVPESLDGAVVSNEYNVFIPEEGTNIQMFNMMMQLPHYKRLFYLMSDGVHIEKLLFKTKDWMRRSLAMPPISEQHKIAEILITCDKVISLKERLITEKQKKKDFLMTILLTGRKRLNGFSDEWTQTYLRNICTISGGGTPDTKQLKYWSGEIPWISSSDVVLGNITDIKISRKITEEAIKRSATQLCPKNSILIVSRVGVGKIAIAPFELCTSQDFTNLINVKGNIYFITLLLSKILEQKLRIIQGSAIKGITAKEIKSFTMNLPSIHEQSAIAEILMASDREIELLKKELEQWQLKKRALMQLLLTGIVRVKI